jgi:diketogulonate reductase-like aldo/keto reductase
VEAIDLYLLHWPSAAVPLEETMEAMGRLVEEGKIRHAGVSNFDLGEMDRAAAALGPVPLACNQVLYHLGDRGVEYDLIPGCAGRGITLMAYSPFGHDGLPGPDTGPGRVLEGIARAHGRTSCQVALNRLVRHEGVVAIPKAVREAHVRENAAALDFDLSGEDLEAIDEAFPPPDGPTPLGII